LLPKQAHSSPQPLLVLVTGKPGSGKSTLACELGRAEHLGLPVVSRDAIKAGMVETWAYAQPGASRSAIETDELRSSLVPRSFELFYKTIASWLLAGTSLIAEYGFDRRTESALATVIGLATTVVIHCEAPDSLCIRPFMKQRGMSVQQLAEQADISLNTARSFYFGISTRVDLPILDRICKVLGVSPAEVLIQTDDAEGIIEDNIKSLRIAMA